MHVPVVRTVSFYLFIRQLFSTLIDKLDIDKYFRLLLRPRFARANNLPSTMSSSSPRLRCFRNPIPVVVLASRRAASTPCVPSWQTHRWYPGSIDKLFYRRTFARLNMTRVGIPAIEEQTTASTCAPLRDEAPCIPPGPPLPWDRRPNVTGVAPDPRILWRRPRASTSRLKQKKQPCHKQRIFSIWSLEIRASLYWSKSLILSNSS